MEPSGRERVVVAVAAEDTPWCSTGPELVADRLFSLGASAVSEVPDVGPSGAGAGAGAGPVVRMVADLPAESLDGLAATGWRFDVLEVDPRWSGGWRDHATSVEVGERFVLRPEWVSLPESAARARTEVVLDAADAFGSGSHPTTRLCLEALERLDGEGSLAGARVLDVGCGTGVLGVATLLLAEDASLVAVDVEPAAIAATARTAELNGVADRVIEVSDRTLAEVVAERGPFDLVLANLLVTIIEELGDDIAAAVAPRGLLVLSGLLSDPELGQVDRAARAVGTGVGGSGGAGLVGDGGADAGGWAALVLRSS